VYAIKQIDLFQFSSGQESFKLVIVLRSLGLVPSHRKPASLLIHHLSGNPPARRERCHAGDGRIQITKIAAHAAAGERAKLKNLSRASLLKVTRRPLSPQSGPIRNRG
jgi:hypothetical protein